MSKERITVPALPHMPRGLLWQVAETAERALHAVDHIFGLHALDQTADALQVAVAAAGEGYVADHISVNVKMDL